METLFYWDEADTTGSYTKKKLYTIMFRTYDDGFNIPNDPKSLIRTRLAKVSEVGNTHLLHIFFNSSRNRCENKNSVSLFPMIAELLQQTVRTSMLKFALSSE